MKRPEQMSRRHSFAVLGGAVVVAGLGACGRNDSEAPSGLAFDAAGSVDATDYAGARIHAIMRDSSLDGLKQSTVDAAVMWSEANNASIDLDFSAAWREDYGRVAREGVGADAAELYGSATHILADRLIDVSAVAEEAASRLGGWFDVARQGAMVDGVWRAVPWAYTGHAINYRKDLLTGIGRTAPGSYQELLETAAALADAGLPRAAFSMSSQAPNDSANIAYSMLWSFGGQEVDESGKRVAIDSAATREAVKFFRELATVSDPRTAEFDEFANNAAFLDGSISMTQNAPSIFSAAIEGGLAIADLMSHARYPSGPNGRHQLVEMNSLGVFNHSRNIEAASGWVRAMTDGRLLVDRASLSKGLFMPPVDGLADEPDMPWNTTSQLEGLKINSDSAHMPGWPGPSTVEAALVYENGSIVRMFADAAWGDGSVDDVVRTAARELARVYET